MLVELTEVSKSYRSGEVETPVLADVSLSLPEKSFTVIFGPSGCGKTTLLNLIGGLDRPSSGRIRVDGVDLTGLDDRALADFRLRRLGFVFQFYNLLSSLTAEENLEIVLEPLGVEPREARHRVHEALEIVGLAGKERKYPDQLSGGEQQRVAVARALVKRPRFVLADEPTGSLDERRAADVVALLRDLNARVGTSFVIASHNRKLRDLASHVVGLHDGQLTSGACDA